MIMGLINYMEVVPAGTSNEEGNMLIEQEIEEFLRRYPKVTTRRIFVFNYSFHLNSVPPSCRLSVNDPLAMTIFPPDGEMCGENESLTSMVDVHLHEVMSNAAVILITSMEAQLMQCEAVRATRNQFWSNSVGSGAFSSSTPAVITSIHSSNTSSNAIRLFTLYDDSFNDVNMNMNSASTAAVATVSSSSPMSSASSTSAARRVSMSSNLSSITSSSMAGASVASEAYSSTKYGHPTAPLSFTYSVSSAYNTKVGSGGSAVSRADSSISSSMALGRDRDMTVTSLRDVMSVNSGGVGSGASSKRVSELGRVRKRMGDLCMQMCSPMDSLEHYAAAVSECRSAGDYMWLAGALEGYASAIYGCFKLELPFQELLSKEIKVPLMAMVNQQMQQEQEHEFQPSDSYDNPPPASMYDSLSSSGGNGWLSGAPCPSLETTSASLVGLSQDQLQELVLWKLAEEKALEALNLYSKCIVLCGLEVECCLKLARLHAYARTVDKERRVLDCVMRAVSVQGLNAQQQIECVLEGAFICKKLGNMSRKYALLLYLAALMSAEDDNPLLALELITHASDEYGIGIRGNATDNSSSLVTISDGDSSPAVWNYIHKTLLLHSAHFATECENHSAAVRCLSEAVCAVAESETKLVAQRSNFCLNSTLLSPTNGQELDPVLLWCWARFYPDEQQSPARIKSFLYHLQFENYQLLELQRLCVLANLSSGAADSLVPHALENYLSSTEVPALTASRGGTEAASEARKYERGVSKSTGGSGAFSKYIGMLKDNQLINERMVAQVSSFYGAATGSGVSRTASDSVVGGFVTPSHRSAGGDSNSVAVGSGLSSYGQTPYGTPVPSGKPEPSVTDRDKHVTPVKKPPVVSFVGPNPTASTVPAYSSTPTTFERVKNSSVVVIEKKDTSTTADSTGRTRSRSVSGLYIRENTKSLLHSVRTRLRNRLYEKNIAASGKTENETLSEILSSRFGDDRVISTNSRAGSSETWCANRGIELADAPFVNALNENNMSTKTPVVVPVERLLLSSVAVHVPFYGYVPGAVCSREQQHIMSLLQGALRKVSPYLQLPLPGSILLSMQMCRPRYAHSRQPIERRAGTPIVKPLHVAEYLENLERLANGEDAPGTDSGSAHGAAVAGSLFFDPFATLKKKTTAAVEEEVVWVLSNNSANDVDNVYAQCRNTVTGRMNRYDGFGTVRAVLHNPFSVPLLLQQVIVILKCHLDVEYETYPVSFIHIPPHAKHYSVDFTVRYFLPQKANTCIGETATREVSFLEAVGLEITYGASISRLYVRPSGTVKTDKKRMEGMTRPSGSKKLDANAVNTENSLVAVVALAADNIVLTREFYAASALLHHDDREHVLSAFRGEMLARVQSSSSTLASANSDATPVRKKLKLKLSRASGKTSSDLESTKVDTVCNEGSSGVSNGLLQLYPGERYLCSVVACNNSQRSLDVIDYEITVYEYGYADVTDVSCLCLRSYVLKSFERKSTATLANRVPVIDKASPPKTPLVSLVQATHVPSTSVAAEATLSPLPAGDKLKLDLQFQMQEGGCFEPIRLVEIELSLALARSDISVCGSAMDCTGDYLHRLSWSQQVHCSAGVAITSLRSISSPWQLTAHQQHQVQSVLHRGSSCSRKATKVVEESGSTSNLNGPEEMCLVGLNQASMVLEHYCSENTAFVEADVDASCDSNSDGFIAMAQTNSAHHYVAVKLENYTNFDVSISTALGGLLTTSSCGCNSDIFVPAPETDYSYHHLLAPNTTRTIICKRSITEGVGSDKGILLPLHAVVHEPDQDKYSAVICRSKSPLVSLESRIVGETMTDELTPSMEATRRCMRHVCRPLYGVSTTLTQANVNAQQTQQLSSTCVTRCKLRQKYKLAIEATRNGTGTALCAASGVEVMMVVISVSEDDHQLTSAALMNGHAMAATVAENNNRHAWGSEHVLVSGKSKCVLPLPQSTSQSIQVVNHSLNLVFVRPGTYKIVCLVRDVKSIANANTGSTCCFGSWYTSPDALVVTV